MTAGCRIDAGAASPLPQLPRPLSEDAPAPPRAPKVRAKPQVIEPTAGPSDRRSRGIMMAACFILVIAMAALPAFAADCRPEAYTEGATLHLARAEGIDRVKIEIGYRGMDDGSGRVPRTYYHVVSSPVADGGRIDYQPPMARAIVSAMVLDAKGPACN